MIEFLFLDLDDTILDFHKAERIAISKTFQSFGLEPTEGVLARYHIINKQHWERLERGELTPEQARTYPGKNYITRAIGTEPVAECDVFHLDVERGDCLLLCSDGLSNMMDDQEILFEVVHGINKQYCCQRLLDIAKNRGAPDNVTSILILI